jgi:hypothetical protein
MPNSNQVRMVIDCRTWSSARSVGFLSSALRSRSTLPFTNPTLAMPKLSRPVRILIQQITDLVHCSVIVCARNVPKRSDAGILVQKVTAICLHDVPPQSDSAAAGNAAASRATKLRCGNG